MTLVVPALKTRNQQKAPTILPTVSVIKATLGRMADHAQLAIMDDIKNTLAPILGLGILHARHVPVTGRSILPLQLPPTVSVPVAPERLC